MFFHAFNPDLQENKQRLNLSEHAYRTLSNDASVFLPEDSPKTETGGIPSGILNQIFRSFAPSAESSISAALENHRLALEEVLSPMHSEKDQKIAIDLLLDAFKSQLLQRCQERLAQKGNAFSIRIDRNNMEYLTQEGSKESGYYQERVGSYFKAVLEEYCQLPYVRRESIYFQSLLRDIHTAIATKKMLKLVVRDSHLTSNRITYMKPYAVRQDSDKKYNYLVGMLSWDAENKTYQCASVRLTSIIRCTILERSGIVKASEKKEIEAKIKASGVPYLSSGKYTQTIKVHLTESGIKMYNSILHLRPQFTNRSCIGGKWVYTFDCLPWQAEIYFFKFGPEARILEPCSLADTLYQKYCNAAEFYQAPF